MRKGQQWRRRPSGRAAAPAPLPAPRPPHGRAGRAGRTVPGRAGQLEDAGRPGSHRARSLHTGGVEGPSARGRGLQRRRRRDSRDRLARPCERNRRPCDRGREQGIPRREGDSGRHAFGIGQRLGRAAGREHAGGLHCHVYRSEGEPGASSGLRACGRAYGSPHRHRRFRTGRTARAAPAPVRGRRRGTVRGTPREIGAQGNVRPRPCDRRIAFETRCHPDGRDFRIARRRRTRDSGHRSRSVRRDHRRDAGTDA